MVVVLVKWKIKPGHEDEFLTLWREKFTIGDCAGLVGEFMCGPGSQEYITWAMRDPHDPPCTIFVNVAIWASAEAFREQVEPKFGDPQAAPDNFEAVRRVRTVLDSVPCWRVGKASLPDESSEGVL